MIFIVDRIEPRWQAVTFAVIVLTFQQGLFEAHYFVKLLWGSLGTEGREAAIQGRLIGIRVAEVWAGVGGCGQNIG